MIRLDQTLLAKAVVVAESRRGKPTRIASRAIPSRTRRGSKMYEQNVEKGYLPVDKKSGRFAKMTKN